MQCYVVVVVVDTVFVTFLFRLGMSGTPVSEKYRGIKSDGIIYRGLAKYRGIPSGGIVTYNEVTTALALAFCLIKNLTFSNLMHMKQAKYSNYINSSTVVISLVFRILNRDTSSILQTTQITLGQAE